MSSTETEEHVIEEQPETVETEAARPLIVRSFAADLTTSDGRTVDGRIVPYNVTATVADPPDFSPYTERFLPGAFEPQTRAPDRVKVLLDFEHQGGISGVIGRGVSLSEGTDGLYGSFRVLNHPDGDKALELVREGILTGMSMFGNVLRSRVKDGVVERVRVHLDRVALCRSPAYQSAQVLAVREAPPLELPEVTPPNFERLEALGIMPVFERAVVSRPWDGSAARFTDQQYQASCLVDRGGDAPVKERCSLPVLEPNGDLNTNALGPAAAALRGARGGLADVTAEQKAAAARKLVRYYRLAQMPPPAGIVMMAG